MGFNEERQLEQDYLMGTYGRKPVQLVRGKGMVVEDDEGKEYLDFVAGVGAVSLGHCHRNVVAALEKQASTLIHVSNYYYIEHRGEVAQQLSTMLNANLPEQSGLVWKSFFSNSGAEANECAIKLARLHARKRIAREAVARGLAEEAVESAAAASPRLIVTLDGSFHGRTLATLAATAQPVKQEAFQPLPDGFTCTPQNDVAALEELFASQGDSICAVLLECVQGESGVHPCTEEFLQAARRLTAERGALLICDEVQCGIYRCGTYPFGFQHYGIVPDIVTIAKGVASGFPTGMCAARAEVAGSFGPGDHGSTFGGSCLAVAAARATLETLDEEDFASRVDRVGSYLRERLAQLDHVVEVRGLGLMVAADVDEATSAPDVVARGLDEGLLLNSTGPRTLRFLPPLVCSEGDVDQLVERLERLLA